MKFKETPKSPVFPRGHDWQAQKRKRGYESEATALIRTMLEDQKVEQDQRFAWDRWRNDERLGTL